MQVTPLKISNSVYYVGIKDAKRRLFDGLVALPKGTSYNSCLVLGSQKNALIDTVNPGFEKHLVRNIKAVMELKQLDYLVMNHAEPDHASAIPYLLDKNKKLKLVTSVLGAEMAIRFYNTAPERIIIVKDQETLSLGDKTLRFIEAPMLHWPETMFTYLEEEKVLFSCDFFGAHTAEGLFDNEVANLPYHAQRYFGEIMMPFRTMGARAMEKLASLPIEVIVPSHGPVYKNVKSILESYKLWTAGVTKPKAVLVYLSMWGTTKKMIEATAKTLREQKIETVIYDLNKSDVGDIAKDLVDSRALVFGSPTVLGGLHPVANFAATLVKVLRPPIQFGVFLGSCGWAGGASKNFKEIVGSLKIELVGDLEIKGPANEPELAQVQAIALALADKLKAVI